MKENFDDYIKEKLKSDLNNIMITASLKNEIKQNTVKRKKGIFENFYGFLNKTVEINLTAVAAIFLVFFIGLYSAFTTALVRNAQDDIKGYQDYTVITIDGINVVVENENKKVSLIEKY